jgi:hypothetical protein
MQHHEFHPEEKEDRNAKQRLIKFQIAQVLYPANGLVNRMHRTQIQALA